MYSVFHLKRFGEYLDTMIEYDDIPETPSLLVVGIPSYIHRATGFAPDELGGSMMLVHSRSNNVVFTEDNIIDSINGIIVSYYNKRELIKVDPIIELIVLNYTKYMQLETAALKIQRTWRKIRMVKAANRISEAFMLWNSRKNELWNPNTFVGIAYLIIQVNRALKED